VLSLIVVWRNIVDSEKSRKSTFHSLVQRSQLRILHLSDVHPFRFHQNNIGFNYELFAETLRTAFITAVTQNRSNKSIDKQLGPSIGFTGTLIAEEHHQKMVTATNHKEVQDV